MGRRAVVSGVLNEGGAGVRLGFGDGRWCLMRAKDKNIAIKLKNDDLYQFIMFI